MIPDRMNTKRISLPALSALLVLGLVGSLIWQSLPARASPANGRKVRLYECPMHPWVKSDQSGKCTICGMDLTPVYEGDPGFKGADNLVVLSANNVTVLNVQTDEVKRRPLNRKMRVAGILEANESRTVIISSPAPSRIQDVAIEYTGVEVEVGQRLITLLSPELVQKRAYLNSIGTPRSVDGKSLSYVVMGSAPFSSVLIAQQAGTVTQRNAFVGQYVSEGEKLLTIVDSSVLWFRFDVYEQQLPWFELGQKIDVSVAAVPGKVFPAIITFIEPTLNEATRTVKVRADVDNPATVVNGHKQRRLRFGMYADGLVQSTVPDALCVPRSAVLFPDASAYVYVDRGQGAYERRQVKLGRQGDESWEVLQGLEEGDRVVTSGNVLIDAQAQFTRGEMPGEAPAEVPMAPSSAPTMGSTGTPAQVSPPPSHAAGDQVRRAVRDEMRNARMAAIAEANGQKVPAGANLASDQPDNTGGTPMPRETGVPPVGFNEPSRTDLSPPATPANTPPPPAEEAPMENTALPVKPTGPGSGATAGAPTIGQPSRTRLDVLNARRNVKDELWNMRLTAIAAAHGQNLDGSPVAIPDEPAVAETAAHNEAVPRANAVPPAVKLGTEGDATRPVSQPPVPMGRSAVIARLNTCTPEERANIRNALMENMDPSQSGSAATANGQKTTAAGGLTEPQRQALTAFLAVADSISRALAADDLKAFNHQTARLASVLPPLQKELATPHPWGGLIEHLAASSEKEPAKDLKAARGRFLAFSTAAVELAKTLRKTDPAFAGLKIYHCPMAPEPGLWIQANSPLANPFFGEKMLTCGDEVLE